MYNLDKITSKLEAGELAVGSHVAFDSPFLTEMIAGAGFDFIWIDAEHGALDRRDIQTHLLACRAAGAAGLVRVPSKDPDGIKGVLDMGADGVIIPMVNTVEEARQLRPPRIIRLMGSAVWGCGAPAITACGTRMNISATWSGTCGPPCRSNMWMHWPSWSRSPLFQGSMRL